MRPARKLARTTRVREAWFRWAAYAALGVVYAGLAWTGPAPLVVAYHVVSRLAYVCYVGLSLRAEEEGGRLSRRYGAEQGFRRFRLVAALIMNNDAASLVLAGWATRGTWGLALPPAIVTIGGLAMILIGGGVKLWAARSLGMRGYYWGDFFLPGERSQRGPYRVLRNPMYTVGYLPVYGLALLCRSLPGVALAAFDHAAIFALYRLVEKPHHDRLYGGASSP